MNKINSNTKNIIIYALIVIMVLGGVFFTSELRKQEEVEVKKEYSPYNELTLAGYLDVIKNEQLTVIYVGNETCAACALFDPVMKEIISEHRINVYHLNLARVTTQTDANKIYESYEDFKDNGINTPTMLIVEKGKVIAAQIGAKTKETTLEFFKTNKVIQGE